MEWLSLVLFALIIAALLAGYPVKSAADAKNMLLWTMDISRRHLGLSQTAVATEFVFSATEALDKYSAFVPEDGGRQPSASLEDHVVGIGVDTTGSTPLPVDGENRPLALDARWKGRLAAQAWLWKDHTGAAVA